MILCFFLFVALSCVLLPSPITIYMDELYLCITIYNTATVNRGIFYIALCSNPAPFFHLPIELCNCVANLILNKGVSKYVETQVRDELPLGRDSKTSKIQSSYSQIHFESKLSQRNSSILMKYFLNIF